MNDLYNFAKKNVADSFADKVCAKPSLTPKLTNYIFLEMLVNIFLLVSGFCQERT